MWLALENCQNRWKAKKKKKETFENLEKETFCFPCFAYCYFLTKNINGLDLKI